MRFQTSPNIEATIVGSPKIVAKWSYIEIQELLAKCWINVGPNLDQCWINVGKTLDQCWINAGPMLAKRWINVGPMLDQCCINVGSFGRGLGGLFDNQTLNKLKEGYILLLSKTASCEIKWIQWKLQQGLQHSIHFSLRINCHIADLARFQPDSLRFGKAFQRIFGRKNTAQCVKLKWPPAFMSFFNIKVINEVKVLLYPGSAILYNECLLNILALDWWKTLLGILEKISQITDIFQRHSYSLQGRIKEIL